MIKKSLAMASLLALGTSAMAIDVQPFVGAGAGASWTKVKQVHKEVCLVSAFSLSESDTESSLKLKGGAILDSSHRIIFSLCTIIS